MKDHLTFSWFCILLRSGLWNKPAQALSESPDWEALMKLARSQAMLGVLFDGINTLPTELRPPRTLYLQWATYVVQIEEANKRLNQSVTELFQQYQEAGIMPILLKGQGMASLYPHPEHRQCGDIDIYVGTQGYPIANHLLLEKGALPSGEESAKHASYSLYGVHIENHRIIAKLNNPLADHRFSELVNSWYPFTSCTVTIQDSRIPVPPATFNVIYIFLHSFLHFLSRGIGFRQLCDWTRLLYMEYERIDCEEVTVHLRRLGLLHAARAFGYIAHRYIGLPADKLPFSIEGAEQSGEALLQEILATGNFGKFDIRICPRPKGYWSGKWHTFTRATGRCRNLYSFAPSEAFWYPVNLIKGSILIQWYRLKSHGAELKRDKTTTSKTI